MNEQNPTAQSNRLKLGLLTIAIPLLALLFNYAIPRYYPDISLFVVFIGIGILIDFVAIAISLIGLLMPTKSRLAFLYVVACFSVASIFPSGFILFINIEGNIEARQRQPINEQENLMREGYQLRQDLHSFGYEHPYPTDIKTFTTSSYNADQYKRYGLNFVEKVHYKVSDDQKSFLVYVDLSVPRSKLDTKYIPVVTETTLGVDCSAEKILCMQ